MRLSRALHEDLFPKWRLREAEVSTFAVTDIVEQLEDAFRILYSDYDIAIAPQCSKMQGLAAYLFWRRHPEVQLLFTIPVRFNPDHYSQGARNTYVYEIE